MKTQKALPIAVSVVLIVCSTMAASLCGRCAPSPRRRPPCEPQLFQGKIAYMERLGGYYIQGIDPPGR